MKEPKLTLRSLRQAFAALALVTLAGAGCAKREEHTSFATADDAVTKLVATVRTGDVAGLEQLFGPGSEDIVDSGDAVADAQARSQFLGDYDSRHELVDDGDGRKVLQVGEHGWPLPVPLVERDGRWVFDGAAGADEVVFRRIGRNELGAISVCRGYVDAQLDYASEDRDGEGAGIYAQKLISDPGLRNGLYWETADGEPPSPVGPFVASAAAEGYRASEAAPYHGYRYRALYRQGPNANGGAVDYFANGVLVNGFGLIAWPAEYGVSGVMTFIVNRDGVVFQKDLGEDTATAVEGIDAFDPDSTWIAVLDSDESGTT